ncbi:MAG: hypothetical protein CMQ39_06855 [Gammaproteobacteria bacterium]|nr:hypothetical protein [Gammaproteobacteria bacterium]
MSMTHPFDPDSLYELTEDGTIKISRDGKTGFFTGEGIYISGEIRSADPQLCNWITNVPNPETQLTASRIAGRDDAGKSIKSAED